ncbi:STAS domain-containing protein [Actinoplanes sp. CA-030573]|uniref:STAS domain-containing protein n=1 Tax=Actinoplanes sp. CA-030573 TaxID=3239898 RepID=UPI003D8C1F46
MARFAATTSEEPGGVRVALAGDCDLAVRDELIATLLAAVDRSTAVVVDLGAVDFLDSSGVHGLVAAHRAAAERGGRLYLENPSGSVAAVLDLTGVAALLARDATGKAAGTHNGAAPPGDVPGHGEGPHHGDRAGE